MKQPDAHAPLAHTWPVPQLVPPATFDQAVVELLGVHAWQTFPGLPVPELYRVPLMKQSDAHAPPAHTWPAPQLVPLATFDQALVDALGVQSWQAFAGLRVPDVYRLPLMKQSDAHAPLAHTWPAPQLVPSATFDQALVELLGVQAWQTFPGLIVPDA
jgi:hypothetical protein